MATLSTALPGGAATLRQHCLEVLPPLLYSTALPGGAVITLSIALPQHSTAWGALNAAAAIVDLQ